MLAGLPKDSYPGLISADVARYCTSRATRFRIDRRDRCTLPQNAWMTLNIGWTTFDAWRSNIIQSATVDPYEGVNNESPACDVSGR
jgi:hypothetical protein